MTRHRLALAASALVAGCTLLATACGVPLDGEPRAIDRTTTTIPSETTVPFSEEDTAPKVGVYFLEDGRLELDEIAVEDVPTVESALGLVLSTQPDAPLQTRIPPGTELLSLRIKGSVASLDLTDAIEDISGPTQKEAYAQIVFTVLEFSEIESVRFLVQGKQVDAPTDNGNLEVVTADDYDPPLSPR